MRSFLLSLVSSLGVISVLAPHIVAQSPSTSSNKSSLPPSQKKVLIEVEQLNNRMLQLFEQGKYEMALKLAKRALAKSEHHFGEDNSQIVSILNNLAELYWAMKRYEEVEPLLKRSLSVRQQHLGANHPNTIGSINSLALFYFSMGQNAAAEPLYKQALVIREEYLGKNHLNTASSLNNLARLYQSLGRNAAAEPLYKRALDIYKLQLGLDHPFTATSLNNLALLYQSIKRYESAEPLYKRALEIREKHLGKDHPNTANSLSNLALLYQFTGRNEDAEPLYKRALDIYKLHFGKEHPNTANSLNNLAILYQSMGRNQAAEDIYKQALAINQQSFGSEHGNSVTSLKNLAALYLSIGEFQEAFQYLQEGIIVQEKVLRRNLIGGSEANKRKYLASITGTIDTAISFHLKNQSQSSKAGELSLQTILQHKGRILDLFINLSQQLVDDPIALAYFEKMRGVSNQLTTLTFNPPKQLSAQAYETELLTLKSRIDLLEDQLSRRSPEFAEFTASPSLKAIQSTLPRDTALAEFIRYRSVNIKATLNKRFGPSRYTVYVLHQDGTIKGIDLGLADEIDQAVKQLTQSMASPDTPLFQIKEEARNLDELVMAPVRKALGSTTTIFLAPDSALNLVPFETLVDQSDQFLVNKYQFRYLTSGRDLMRQDKRPTNTGQVVLMGDPTFGRSDQAIAQQRTFSLNENRFPILKGTGDEVKAIAQKFPGAQVYLNASATEAQLKAAKQPRILHIATHGFFSSSEDNVNPLLNSGLVLAGVQERKSGPEQDGVLSALEVTGLNLRGTQLAVLSACQTGLGELIDGEGVYGLRRALMLAGTQSQVISLWKVDDQATKELMVDYYDRLKAGKDRDAALRETQRAFLEHPEYSHPYYWAAFIASGNWRPLTLK